MNDTASPSTGALPPAPTYAERYRPQVHFTPPVNWMNDPNGLVYYDGEYHLFYQHNPRGNTWGHMSWGHAVSPDLLHWEHLPLAIPEADGLMAFSGSAVVDWHNTTGFGSEDTPPLVALFTGHRPGVPAREDQRLAYSLDRGRTWTLYEGNPVLDLGRSDFRDPKVFWHAPDRRWVMAIALPHERRIEFYASPDLKRWTHLSTFGPGGATGGIWECPDLFELPVDGDPAHTRWVLVVNLNPGGPAGGSAAQYFVGHFDGTTFTPEPPISVGDTHARWLDWGADYYAAVSWSGAPDGERILLGWMNDWRYANAIPTAPWRSAQALPRRVELRTLEGHVTLVQQPIAALQSLRQSGTTLAGRVLAPGTHPVDELRGTTLEIEAEFALGTATAFGLAVRVGGGDETRVGYDAATATLFVDRMRSGDTRFHPAFATRHGAPLPAPDGRVHLRIIVDAASVEVFAGGGHVTITDQIFPAPSSDGLALFAEGGTAQLLSLKAWPLASVWPAPPVASAPSPVPDPSAASAPILCVGEVLWDSMPAGLFLGGAPLNVAYHLRQLGREVRLVSRVGDDALGHEVLRRLERAGLATDAVQVDPERPTGFVRVDLDAEGSPSYEIVRPAAWDAITLTGALRATAAQARAVVFGSLAQREAVSRETVRALAAASPCAVFDVNLRPPFDDADAVRQSLAVAQAVKLNDDELRTMAGWFGLGTGVRATIDALAEQFGLRMGGLTRGGEGAALWHEGRWTEHPGCPADVRDTVGAGDAFLAGLLAALLDGEDDATALHGACTLGAFVAGRSGATPAYDADLRAALGH